MSWETHHSYAKRIVVWEHPSLPAHWGLKIPHRHIMSPNRNHHGTHCLQSRELTWTRGRHGWLCLELQQHHSDIHKSLGWHLTTQPSHRCHVLPSNMTSSRTLTVTTHNGNPGTALHKVLGGMVTRSWGHLGATPVLSPWQVAREGCETTPQVMETAWPGGHPYSQHNMITK